MGETVTILVIDDNEDDRLFYRRVLSKGTDIHYHIIEAEDGKSGLEHLGQEPPDCILLDYSLPGHNGIEVLKQIRSQYPFIPVVMLTGQGNENVAVAAMQSGAQNYISKSHITSETLEHVIHMAREYCMLKKRIHEQRTSLEVFTRALAHDLREPVRTIRSFAELIAQNERFSDKTLTHFRYIEKAAERMHMLIDTVFLYTRLDDSGQITREVCDTGFVLKEVEDNLTQLIHERHTAITCEPLPQLYVNRTQLMQLLQNLICNSIQHSEEPVAIHISATPQEDDWLFRVADNGPGIEKAYLQKIFEPFKRVGLREDQGAGLGLAICRKIVESNGGKIWCESSAGAGATFFFTLPRQLPASVATSSDLAEAPDNNNGAKSNGSLANVLLVDDSKADVEITRFRLMEDARMQCNFFVARNGKEALARLYDKSHEGGPIDLMLLDINMPLMDGFEVLERVRAEETLRQMPVIMCTGSTYDKDKDRAQALGANGYLTKPVEFSRIKAIINNSATIQLRQQENDYLLLRIA